MLPVTMVVLHNVVLQKVRDLKKIVILFRDRAVRVELRPQYLVTSAVRARAATCQLSLNLPAFKPVSPAPGLSCNFISCARSSCKVSQPFFLAIRDFVCVKMN